MTDTREDVTREADHGTGTGSPSKRWWARFRSGHGLLRRLILGTGLVLLLFAALLALAYPPASSARAQLLSGKQTMESARTALLDGDLAQARQRFDRAHESFTHASELSRRPALRIAGWLPLVGRTPRAVAAIADAGALVAEAGGQLAGSLEALPGGLAALGPRGGVFPVSPFAQLTPALERAALLTRSALSMVERTRAFLLFQPVAEARREAIDQLSSLATTMASAKLIAMGLPDFLGVNGPRRYFFGPQNPAELRGTGGFVGTYSILTIDGGRFEFSPFHTITDIPDFPLGTITPPNPDYERNYDWLGGAGVLRNANWTPDFPSAAVAFLRTYEKATGDRLDGMIAADPFTLQALLQVTGPIESRGVALDPDTVVRYTTHDAYGEFSDPVERKFILGEVAKAVFERFAAGTGEPVRAARVLGGTIAEGHLLVYSHDPNLQAGLARAGVAGALPRPSGDFLSVVVNSGSGTKIDSYLQRSISYSVRLLSGERATANVALHLNNSSPAASEDPEVIGPYANVSRAGENVPIVSLYCPRYCNLKRAGVDGVPRSLYYGSESGDSYYLAKLRIPTDRSTDVTYSLLTYGAWQGDGRGGTYRLTFLNQTTLRPSRVHFEIRVPDGMSITDTSIPLRVTGSTAVWDGVPGRHLGIEVRFRPSLPLRMWRGLLHFLSTPIV